MCTSGYTTGKTELVFARFWVQTFEHRLCLDFAQLRFSASLLVLYLASASLGVAPSAAVAEAPTFDVQQWVMPRTPDGRPDLQGNWSNATLTQIQRAPGLGPILTPQQVAMMEGGAALGAQAGSAASDPDREAPPAGGIWTGNPLADGASGGTGVRAVEGIDRVSLGSW